MLDIFDESLVGMAHQHVSAGRHRLGRIDHRRADRWKVCGEGVEIFDQKRQMRRTKTFQARIRPRDEQDRRDLRKPEIIFRIVEAKASLLPDQGLINATASSSSFSGR